jgi:glycosyltransferase involved in cell wall biosynthesis
MNKNTDQIIPLSVVIISKNEEENIASSIESAISATKEFNDSEIILADSASTDRTIEIAKKYPIRIVQLKPFWRLSPSAGCYSGFLQSKGEFIQFIGGDMILDNHWFTYAIPILEKEEIGGVSGICTQENYGTIVSKRVAKYHNNLPFGEIPYLVGATFFKRNALLESGPFNPWLRANEEGELSYRVRDKGYKLMRLPYHITHHLGGKNDSLKFFFKKQVLSAVAQGQIIRYSLYNRRILSWRLKNYNYKIKITGFFLILFGTLAIISANFGFFIVIYLWILAIIVEFLLIFLKIRKVKYAIKLLITQTLKSPFFFLGFIAPKRNPDAYPADVEVIQ